MGVLEFLLVGEATMEATDLAGPALPPLPAGSIIRIHVAEPGRLALDIPPGKKAASLGCFAIVWNGFIGVFSVFVGLIALNDQNREFSVVATLFLGVFWLVGLGLIFAWVKLRFERSLLFVDRERAVLRKILFGRQKQKEAALNETSRAELTESYSENERPVYRVTIVGADGTRIHFGTSLDQREKDWCVDAINAVLQPVVAEPPIQPPPDDGQ
jgi:hypothetical protein